MKTADSTEPTEQPKLNRRTRRRLQSKSVVGRFRKGSKKRPAWMNYLKSEQEVQAFTSAAQALGISVPKMMRWCTVEWINSTLDAYQAQQANEQSNEDMETSDEDRAGSVAATESGAAGDTTSSEQIVGADVKPSGQDESTGVESD